jgi:hypothetical protein
MDWKEPAKRSLIFYPNSEYEDKLNNFFNQVANSNCKQFILIFSGTSFMHEYIGNRPNQLALELIKKDIPVFYSYQRWRYKEPIPVHSNPKLFQSPNDLTIKYMDQIINYKLEGKQKIFIISFPHAACAKNVNALNTKEWLTIYDVRDDWEEFQRVGQASWYNKTAENKIVNDADVVCAVSKPLQKKMQSIVKRQKHIYLSPNALNTNVLRDGEIKPPQRKGQPIIGYFGHLTNAWFDWDELITIAEKRPSWKFELIGRSFPGIKLPENIKYLGPKSIEEIKEISKHWWAAMIPFKISPLSDSVDPIKVYEYLALGLPVVSFRMPQIHNYPYVYISNNTIEFMKNIKKALRAPIDTQKINRFLRNNLWEDRANQFIEWGRQYGNKL